MTDDATDWQVHRLLHRYIAAVDGRDADGVAACFVSDGRLTVRGVGYAGDEIAAFYSEKLIVPTLHFITGVTIGARDDGLVTSTCGLFAIEMHDDGWRGIAGRYDDVITVDPDGRRDAARFVSRSITFHPRVRLSPEP